ncbi:MAG: TAXI family TRAP transporter solute-binding subunit [Armatimonadetes bacterium]|nr:TAXI family TRAP transporter solute-binding subunit [Armatimonadota bacterium]
MRASSVYRGGIIVALALIVAAGSGAIAQQRRFVNVATGGTAGVYFPLGAALARTWTEKVSGVQSSSQATGASVANVNLLQKGDVEVAFVQNDIVYYAFNGIEMFARDKQDRLRGMAMLYPETIQLVTLQSKNINSVADLRGKRVAVGAPKSGTEVNARQILRAYDIGYTITQRTTGLTNLITAEFLSFAEAADQLKDGVIDAAFITAGHPTAAVQDIAASRDIKIVSIPANVVERLREPYPYYTAVTIPANTYRGQTADVPTTAVMAMLVTRQEVPEDLVYQLTKALWENVTALQQAHARGRDIRTETARNGMPVTMHAGALRYYRERNIR